VARAKLSEINGYEVFWVDRIVAKRKLGIYKDDGNSWLKVKNRTYSQAEGRHELLTRGR
jgi:hypothetical protein